MANRTGITIASLVMTVFYVITFTVFLIMNHLEHVGEQKRLTAGKISALSDNRIATKMGTQKVMTYIGFGLFMLIALVFSSWQVRGSDVRQVQLAGVVLVAVVPILYYTAMMYMSENRFTRGLSTNAVQIALYATWGFLAIVLILEAVLYWGIK
jgi:uncharacterized membrane protein